MIVGTVKNTQMEKRRQVYDAFDDIPGLARIWKYGFRNAWAQNLNYLFDGEQDL